MKTIKEIFKILIFSIIAAHKMFKQKISREACDAIFRCLTKYVVYIERKRRSDTRHVIGRFKKKFGVWVRPKTLEE